MKSDVVQRTIFDIPVASRFLHLLALALLKITGWQRAGAPPAVAKYVMIAAPHTSNWDLPVMLMFAFAFRMRVFWMGKHTLFRWPFGMLFRRLGGIAIDRRKAHNAVAQAIDLYRDNESFALIVAPEGTRKRVAHWKTGFYRIACGAGVPIILGFLDYRHKVGGMGPLVTPSGDIDRDMKTIREFYADITAKRSAESGRACVAPEEP